MFTNRRQAAEARRQKDSWAKQRHQRDRRRKWQRRSIELLEDRSLLDANFNNFPAAMDTMLTALQTSLNDQVMSVNMPLIGTGLKQPPSDSQLLATFQNKFDAALNGQIPTQATVTAALTQAGANVQVTVQDSNHIIFTVGLPQAATTLAENFDFHTGLLVDVTNFTDDNNQPVKPVQVNLGMNGAGASQLVFTVTDTDVLLNPTDTRLSVHVQSGLSNLMKAHAEFAGILPVVVADGGNANDSSIGLTKSYANSNFHGDFNLGLSGGNVSYTTLQGNNKSALDSVSTINFANGKADINLGMAVDTSKFANVQQTFPTLGTDLDIKWDAPDGTVTNSLLPGNQAISFNDLQIAQLTHFLDNLLAPVMQPLNQHVVPAMEAVIALLEQPLPIINETLPQVLG